MRCVFCAELAELVGHVLHRKQWVDIPHCAGHKHKALSDGLLEKLTLGLPAVHQAGEDPAASVDPETELVSGAGVLTLENVFEEGTRLPAADIVRETHQGRELIVIQSDPPGKVFYSKARRP